MSGEINITIIIATYNDATKLRKALDSINKIDYSNECFEVIIVDDGSNDETKSVVSDFCSSVAFRVVYVFQENQGPAAARNVGILKSCGDYLLFIDSDCSVDSNIINCYLEHFPDESLGGVGGDVIPDTSDIIAKYLDYIDVWRPGRNAERVEYLVTANAFFLKDAVIKSGLFDVNFTWPGGEEPELCYRILKNGYYLKYDEKASVVHSHRTTVKGTFRMFFNHGKGFALFVMNWPERMQQRSLCRAFCGVDAIKRFFNLYLFRVNFFVAATFFFLDYLRFLSNCLGYRSVVKS